MDRWDRCEHCGQPLSSHAADQPCYQAVGGTWRHLLYFPCPTCATQAECPYCHEVARLVACDCGCGRDVCPTCREASLLTIAGWRREAIERNPSPELTSASDRVTVADMPTTQEQATEMRRCPTCRQIFPCTSEYFYIQPSGRRCSCWPCERANRAAARARRQQNGGRTTERRSSTPRFGVEIEFVGISRYDAAEALRRVGVTAVVEHYNHSTRRHWKITTDASVAGGGELVSPPLVDFEELELVVTTMVEAGATVNSSCGLHVHHEILSRVHNPTSFGNIFDWWEHNQANIKRLIPSARRHSQWCRDIDQYDVSRIRQVALGGIGARERRTRRWTMNRYVGLNVACFPRQGTIEVRLHGGTLNFQKIKHWTLFGQAIIRLALTDIQPRTCTSLAALLALLVQEAALPAETRDFLLNRERELNVGTVVTV